MTYTYAFLFHVGENCYMFLKSHMLYLLDWNVKYHISSSTLYHIANIIKAPTSFSNIKPSALRFFQMCFFCHIVYLTFYIPRCNQSAFAIFWIEVHWMLCNSCHSANKAMVVNSVGWLSTHIQLSDTCSNICNPM